jgi:hypothetical protein
MLGMGRNNTALQFVSIHLRGGNYPVIGLRRSTKFITDDKERV